LGAIEAELAKRARKENVMKGHWLFQLTILLVVMEAMGFGRDFFAVVDQNGKLVRGDSGAVSVFRYGPGRYEVSFNAAVNGCSYTATIGDPSNGVVYGPGWVFTAGGHLSANGVYLETKNTGGGLSDYPFHLSVNCTSKYAVVSGGSLVRGDAKGVTWLGPGRYEVSFGQPVNGCSYTATIGDPGNGLVYSPGWVFTAGGHNSVNDVYIETKNTGGGLADYPFHLNVNCVAGYAVVNSTALVRGDAQSVSRLGAGRYEVVFTGPVNNCGYTATIGDPSNGLVYAPGLVFTAGGHSSVNAVYLETKNPGGGLSDFPFHLSLSCPAPIVTPPLTGFVDLHTHPLANLAFGGKLLYGGIDAAPGGGSLLPADPDCNHNVRATTMQQALGHDRSTHGGWNLFNNGCGDLIREKVIHTLQTQLNAADESSDADGAPDFTEWPVWNDVTHQKMWVDWIQRTYNAGLRVMVALATNNKTLGDATAGPGDYATDDKSSGDLQITEIKGFVGRHSDFMEMAYSSADVQRIVGANKLAVVLGVELDNIGALMQPTGPFLPPSTPTNAQISAELDRLYGEGVRYIFPIHLVDNEFGGTAAYEDQFNYANFFETGNFWSLACADAADNINYEFNPSVSFEQELLELVKLGSIPSPPSYPNCGQRNSRPLTASGTFAIKEMMRRGMLIDVDHMSELSANAAIDMATQVPGGGYPLNSGHNGIRGLFAGEKSNERALTSAQYKKIGGLHGMAGVGSVNRDAYAWTQEYSAVLNAMGGNAVAGFGTDTNGLAQGMPPSSPDYATTQNPNYAGCVVQKEQDYECTSDLTASQLAACRARAQAVCLQQYPPVTTCTKNCGRPLVVYGPSFQRSSLGTKTWDYNSDGVAHYGMIADFLQDLKNVPAQTPNGMTGPKVIDNLMQGAEYFFETWRLCERQKANVQ
jgi:hypothetical protein